MESTDRRTFTTPRMTARSFLRLLIVMVVVFFLVALTYPRIDYGPIDWGSHLLGGLFLLPVLIMYGLYRKEVQVTDNEIVLRRRYLWFRWQDIVGWDKVRRVEIYPDVWSYLSGWAIFSDWGVLSGREPRYKTVSLTLRDCPGTLKMALDFGTDEDTAFVNLLQAVCSEKGVPYRAHWRQ